MATVRTVTLEELGVVLGELTARAPEALRSAVEAHVMDLLRQVLVEHMTGQDLGVVTGTARRSMVGLTGPGRALPVGAIPAAATSGTAYRADRIVGAVGSPLAYVRAHEEGFSGSVNVRAHVRKRMGRSEALTPSGRRSRKRVVTGFANVRAHSRMMDVKAKHFVKKSIEEIQGRLPDRVHSALLFLASTGRVPTAADVIRGAGA